MHDVEEVICFTETLREDILPPLEWSKNDALHIKKPSVVFVHLQKSHSSKNDKAD